MYALVVDNVVEEYPTTINTLKTRHPNTLFPKSFDDFDVSEYGLEPVTDPGQPEYNNSTHQLTGNSVQLVDNVWTVVYQVTALTTEELEQRNTSLASFIRSERNLKLSNSDWTQLADSTADKTAWAIYRAALRDLPATSGFPQNITWPTEPS